MREKVIVTKLLITQAGQIKHFQVKIPHDAQRIIGIELTARYASMQIIQPQPIGIYVGFSAPSSYSFKSMLSLGSGDIFQITPDLLLGDVNLQSCEKTNIFFSGDVFFGDENLGYGDFTAMPRFSPSPATHGYKREEYETGAKGETTILKGIYRDRQQGVQGGINSLTGPIFFQYTVGVYVWYEIKTDEA